jgi:hypothetical protein
MPFGRLQTRFSTEARFIEQRQSPRQRVRCPAWIDVGDGSPVRACTLWDVSDAGARISIENPTDVPREFTLVLSADGSIRRRCRVIWASDEQLGARYLTAPDWSWTA